MVHLTFRTAILSCECEGCSYTPKYVEWCEYWQFSCLTSLLFCEAFIETTNTRLRFHMRGGGACDQAFENRAFECVWPSEDHVHWWSIVIFTDGFSMNGFMRWNPKGKIFKDYKALVETQSKHKIKIFWSDNGGEFVSKDQGIQKQNLHYICLNKIKWRIEWIVSSWRW